MPTVDAQNSHPGALHCTLSVAMHILAVLIVSLVCLVLASGLTWRFHEMTDAKQNLLPTSPGQQFFFVGKAKGIYEILDFDSKDDEHYWSLDLGLRGNEFLFAFKEDNHPTQKSRLNGPDPQSIQYVRIGRNPSMTWHLYNAPAMTEHILNPTEKRATRAYRR